MFRAVFCCSRSWIFYLSNFCFIQMNDKLLECWIIICFSVHLLCLAAKVPWLTSWSINHRVPLQRTITGILHFSYLSKCHVRNWPSTSKPVNVKYEKNIWCVFKRCILFFAFYLMLAMTSLTSDQCSVAYHWMIDISILKCIHLCLTPLKQNAP